MANNGKNQTFPYSYKTIAIPVNAVFVYYQPYLEVYNPINILTSEMLQTHVRLLFDSSISASLKKLVSVKVAGLDANGNIVRAPQGITLNQSAVGNVVDVTLDLSPYLYKTGRNRIILEVPSADQYGSLAGTNIVQLWKADLAYTVKGVS